MNHLPKLTWITLLIAVASAGAQAQTTMGKTREEARQELIAAVRNGGLPRGEAMGESLPNNAVKQPAMASRTRAEVVAELDAARRNGDLPASGESSLTLNELHPSLYPQHPVVAAKTRGQVLAELAEAQRSGDMVAAGESGMKLNEIHPGAFPKAAMPVYAGASANAADKRLQ
jgi:hypothetical protein